MSVSDTLLSQERTKHRSPGRDALLREFLQDQNEAQRRQTRNSSSRTSLEVSAAAGGYTFLRKWGAFIGGGNGELYSPRVAAVDNSGNVYVTDAGNSRIQKFSSSGKFIAKWGSLGRGNGQFNWPRGIAVDNSGNVYVADTFNNRIQRFSSSGAYLSKWGSWGTGINGFQSPMGITIDDSGNVYVADTGNQRIKKFGLMGGNLIRRLR
jgi:hypothetical protein